MSERMRLLFGYDGSSYADAALDDLLCAGLPRDVEGLILSVGAASIEGPLASHELIEKAVISARVETIIERANKQASQSMEEAKRLAANASERLRSSFPDWLVRDEALAGKPSEELIRKADEWQADLIVVGSQGRSALERFFLGSVSNKVVTDSQHSVRVAREAVAKNDSQPPSVMIGVDGSPEAEHAVRAVGMRVWPKGTKVRIIAVDDGTSPARISPVLPLPIDGSEETKSEAARIMVEWAERELGAIGLDVSGTIEKGAPALVIIEEARNCGANSIFVGSRKFDGAFERFWLGSVSTALVKKAHCSVEVVR
jgi:nucleotide-binding universal stress UspA family protein